MPDTYLNTASTNFASTVHPLILKQVQATLRAGLAYTPRGSLIGAKLVAGTNGVFRSVAYSDLPDGAFDLEDASADPDIEDVEIDFIEFTGTRKGRIVGFTDNSSDRSPHSLLAIAVDKVARSIAVHMDSIPRTIYGTGEPSLFGGAGNTVLADVAAGDVMTADLLKNGVATLRSLDVPPLPSGTYAFAAHPFVIRDLQADADYVNEMRFADPKSFLTGEVGRYAGASIVDAGSRGLFANNVGAGGIDVYQPVLIGANAVFASLGDVQTFVLNRPDKSDPLNRRHVVSWKAFTGGVVNDLQAERFLTFGVAASL